MKPSRPHLINTGVWTLGPQNRNGIRDVKFINSQTCSSLERYVQSRKLISGDTSYYWCVPSWAKRQFFPLKNEPLGRDAEMANKRARFLNAYLDAWRT